METIQYIHETTVIGIGLTFLLKRSWIFSYAQRRKQTVYYLSVNIRVRALGPCLLLFTVRVTKQHPVNISCLKKLVQCIIEVQSVLPS